MTNTILVTYASRSGSTAGVAEAIGETLAQCGMDVELRPMQEVDDLTAYRAIVAGSAIQDQQWLPEAMQFLKRHQTVLKQKPFAIFAVCMTMTIQDGKYRDGVAAWLEPVRALVKPVSEGLFAGTLDISKVPTVGKRLKFRLSVLSGVWSEGDHRDWDAIRGWASSLPEKL
jgi:menaquinone-dependent protoporphyrinogen oxidase